MSSMSNTINDLVLQGSIGAIAQQSGKSLAESFISADVIAIIDTSGSMASTDSRDGKSRYTVACEELAALQNSLPGKIAVISFSSDVQFCPSGVPFQYGAGTDLVRALQFCKVADVTGMQFVLVSDGEPDQPDRCIEIARTYKNKINVIYVGSEKLPTGRDFLMKLAAATGGKTITADRAKELAAGVHKLLQSGY